MVCNGNGAAPVDAYELFSVNAGYSLDDSGGYAEKLPASLDNDRASCRQSYRNENGEPASLTGGTRQAHLAVQAANVLSDDVHTAPPAGRRPRARSRPERRGEP